MSLASCGIGLQGAVIHYVISPQERYTSCSMTDEDMMPRIELGRAIRALRRERKVTQRELAKRAKVHSTWISRLEAGDYEPSFSSIVKLTTALGIPFTTLAAKMENNLLYEVIVAYEPYSYIDSEDLDGGNG